MDLFVAQIINPLLIRSEIMAKAAKEAKPAKATGEAKAKRAPSAYNVFMKTEIAKVKKANPGFDHKEAFKAAAGNWKGSAANKK